MDVLVTGATGFLGTVLVKKLQALDINVCTCNSKIGNLLDYKNLDVFDDKTFDYIFHLAANTKAGDWCMYNSGTQWITNQLINTNILRFWSEKQPQAKMIAVGTSCSYDPQLPLKECNYELGTPDEDLYYYAQTKRMLLTGLKAIQKQQRLEWLYVIPSTLYGPGYNKRDNHFIFDLVRKIWRGHMKGSPVVLWGDGNQKRELIHVDDFVSLLCDVLHKNNEIINIGRGKEYSIKEYAETICELVGYDPSKIEYDTTKFTGVRSKCLDITKLNTRSVGFEYITLKDGLKELVDWEDTLNGVNVL